MTDHATIITILITLSAGFSLAVEPSAPGVAFNGATFG